MNYSPRSINRGQGAKLGIDTGKIFWQSYTHWGMQNILCQHHLSPFSMPRTRYASSEETNLEDTEEAGMQTHWGETTFQEQHNEMQ